MSEARIEALTVESPVANRVVADEVEPSRRPRWKRWLVGVVVLLVLLVTFLPNIAALTVFRGLLFSVLMPGLKERVSVDELSLAWFSPIRAEGVRMQGDADGRPALSIDEIASDASLWNFVADGQLGTLRVLNPEVFVQLDHDDSNWGRLIREFHGTPKLDRAVRLEIVDAKVSVQGPSSPQPWSLDQLTTSVAFSPATANPHGVPLIQGDELVLLDETELTPELCDDLLKYIVPSLAGVTQTSGRVSLEIDEYSWPIGKPDEAIVKGELILHSVDIGPGVIADSLIRAVNGLQLPNTLNVVQNDVVAFWVENGRVYHKNFALGVHDLPKAPFIRTEGSVGFDQSLDLTVKAQIPESDSLPDSPLRDLVNTILTFRIGGTLEDVQVSWLTDGTLTPILKGIGNARERLQERLRENPPRPSLLRNRRRGGDDATRRMR